MATERNPFKTEDILKAFFVIYRQFNERLPTTVWIFENNAYDSFVLCEKDTKFASDCIPDASLWKSSCPNRNAIKLEENDGKLPTEKTDVSFVSVKKKDIRKLLKYLLLIKHLRVEIFQFNAPLFEKFMKASPSDLSDVNEILFGEDGETECSEILGLGPICSLQLIGDIRYIHTIYIQTIVVLFMLYMLYLHSLII